jgi:hypothetical protein
MDRGGACAGWSWCRANTEGKQALPLVRCTRVGTRRRPIVADDGDAVDTVPREGDGVAADTRSLVLLAGRRGWRVDRQRTRPRHTCTERAASRALPRRRVSRAACSGHSDTYELQAAWPSHFHTLEKASSASRGTNNSLSIRRLGASYGRMRWSDAVGRQAARCGTRS